MAKPTVVDAPTEKQVISKEQTEEQSEEPTIPRRYAGCGPCFDRLLAELALLENCFPRECILDEAAPCKLILKSEITSAGEFLITLQDREGKDREARITEFVTEFKDQQFRKVHGLDLEKGLLREALAVEGVFSERTPPRANPFIATGDIRWLFECFIEELRKAKSLKRVRRLADKLASKPDTWCAIGTDLHPANKGG